MLYVGTFAMPKVMPTTASPLSAKTQCKEEAAPYAHTTTWVQRLWRRQICTHNCERTLFILCAKTVEAAMWAAKRKERKKKDDEPADCNSVFYLFYYASQTEAWSAWCRYTNMAGTGARARKDGRDAGPTKEVCLGPGICFKGRFCRDTSMAAVVPRVNVRGVHDGEPGSSHTKAASPSNATDSSKYSKEHRQENTRDFAAEEAEPSDWRVVLVLHTASWPGICSRYTPYARTTQHAPATANNR
jgi:hypothetical protein